MFRAVFSLVVAAGLIPQVVAQDRPQFSEDAIMAHVRRLAGDDLRGRGAGTRFERLAAEYIAGELEARGIGLPPGGERFQAVPLPPAGARESLNVYGWIPGKDERLRDRVIVLGAHLDHLGAPSGVVHPGADDNASGVAVVIEIAALLHASRSRLGRSVLVAFVGAEEIGLHGSTRLVEEGPVDSLRIDFMVNVDMIGRSLADQKVLGPLKRLMKIDDENGIGVIGARGLPFLIETVEAAAAAVNLDVFGTRTNPLVTAIVEGLARNRSDHAPFERVGIPTLFFGSGESDDYHRPTDTIEMLRPALMARRAAAVFGTVVTLSRAPAEKLPPRRNAVPPAGGERVETARIVHGDLDVLLRDNSGSPGVLSGVQSLFNRRDASGFDAFDPDSPGASAGLNFEHIISGHADAANRFTPRRGRYDLYELPDERSAMLVRFREDSPWDVSSTLKYTVVEPDAVDVEFRCVPRSRERFGRRGHGIFFFASYMNDVVEAPIHFLGVDRAGADEQWIAADVPPGHPDWNRGGTYRHLGAAPLEYDSDHDFRLNSWCYDWPRYTRPFYYGRAARDMVYLIMFDRAHTPIDEVRFSLFTFKLPERPRPAWDFQYVIHRVEEDREYGFRARVVWKRWVSRADCVAEYERWRRGLGTEK